MEAIGAGLAGVLGRLLDDPEAIVIFLTELWPDIAGDDLSRRTRPVRIDGSCLWIEVDEPEWKVPLEAMSATVLSRIERFFGGREGRRIERIRVQIRPGV